jgi:hypothetical protein
MLQRNQSLWARRKSDFLADSGSSSADYLQAIAGAGFTHWSVSYNKWTTVPERMAAALPENVWSPTVKTLWSDGTGITEQHTRNRARRLVARVEVPPAWITWWQNWEQRWWPPVVAGRPSG